MTNVGSIRPSRVERDSVNSIVVDPEPHNAHEKMMVAANVALNPSGSATLARATTLLPSIPGLPHLLCLMFAPTAELRCVGGVVCVGGGLLCVWGGVVCGGVGLCVCVCVCVWVGGWVGACAHACVRACITVYVCVRVYACLHMHTTCLCVCVHYTVCTLYCV